MLHRHNTLRVETLEPRKMLAGFDPMSAGGLDSPWDVQFGPDGNGDAIADLYVSGQGSNDVLRYDGRTGAFLDAFVQAGSGGLDSAAGIEFGPDGNLYVVSRDAPGVLRYDGQSGALIDEFVPIALRRLERPRVARFGPDGNLYVTDVAFDEVRRFDGTTGAYMGAFVTSSTGGLDNPTDVAWGPDSNLYVSSTSGSVNAVLRYDGISGEFIDQFVTPNSGGIDGPAHLRFADDGMLYVSAWRSEAIFRYDANTGAFVDKFVASNTGRMERTTGFAFGVDGNLYVASRGTDEVLTVAGPHSAAPGEFLEAFVSAGTPPQPIDPPGSLISAATTEARIATPGDVDAFPFSMPADQTITLIATPLDPSLQLQLSLEGPTGTLASAVAAEAGAPLALQTINTGTGGRFTPRVEGAGAGVGKYTLDLLINAAVEDESLGGAANNSRATAQDVSSSFLALPGGGQRGAVIATTEGSEETRTFSSTDVPILIPDEDFTFSSLTVPDDGVISDINISFEIDHSYTSDLAALLESPRGTIVELFYDVGNNGMDFVGTTLDDEADVLILAGQAPFDGSTDESNGRYQPFEPLALFDGEDMAGEWTLNLGDLFFLDEGFLDAWSLEISTRAPSVDFFSLTLVAGQSLSAQLTPQVDGEIDLEVQDADGNPVAATGDNDVQLSSFIAPSTGTYFIRVQGDTDYTLLQLRDAVYADPAADSFASAQPLGSAHSVVGRLNSRYELTSEGDITQVEAEAIAMGGQLVTINDQREQELVLDLFEGSENGFLFYIGATDRDEEGDWTWMSGQPFLFDGWQGVEPNDAGAGEDFAVHDRRGWNDEWGQNNRRGIVEFGGRQFFSIELAEGDVLNLTTGTPGDQPDAATGLPNLFDARIRLYDDQQTLLAEDDNSAIDGKNALLSYTVPPVGAGTYFIELLPSEIYSGTTEGEFTLLVELNPPPQLPGDFNGNGTVEQGDLDLVLLHWGMNGGDVPAAWVGQQPTGSIDQDELDAVLLNWGTSQAAAQVDARQAAFSEKSDEFTTEPTDSFDDVDHDEPTRTLQTARGLARTLLHSGERFPVPTARR